MRRLSLRSAQSAGRFFARGIFFLIVAAAAASQPVTLYDADAEHLWNRLHRVLFIRTSPSGMEFGHDAVNPLLRPRSTHLLTGTSREQAVAILREFLEKNGEKLVADATRRALLQRGLWAAFDWAAEPSDAHRPPGLEPAARELSELLGRVLARLTLTAEEVRALPDTYRAAVASKKFPTAFDEAAPDTPFLPPDLLDPAGGWVCLGEQVRTQGRTFLKLVPRHVDEFSSSVFAVFIWMPEGRAATKAWLGRLNNFATPWVVDGRRVSIHRDLPQFPHGTQLALLRCAMVIGPEGALVPTRIVESLQVRRYHAPADKPGEARQVMQEFVLTRKGADSDAPVSLRSLGKDEKGFREFSDLADAFEPQGPGRWEEPHLDVVLKTCIGCHHDPGVRSFNTYTRTFGPQLTVPPPLVETTMEEREQASIYWKQTRYDWGLLRGLMMR